VCSVGGGGLLIGILQALHDRHWDEVPVIAVETEGAATLYSSMKAGRLVTLDSIDTIAKSLGAMKVAKVALEMSDSYNVIPYLVTDAEAAMACVKLANDHKIIIEVACGAAVAPAYFDRLQQLVPSLDAASRVVVVACGGSNVSLEKLLQYKAEYAHLVPPVKSRNVPSSAGSGVNLDKAEFAVA